MSLNRIKYALWISKKWIETLYIYPQNEIATNSHFDYNAYWKERRGEYMGRLGRWQAKRSKLAAEIISKHQGKSVNDIGSGSGEVLMDIKKRANLSVATAIDSSPYALEIAKSLGLETQQFDFTEKYDATVIKPADFTTMFEILEHISESEILLKKAYENSNKGVLFSFPNTGFFTYRFRLFFFGKFPLQWVKHPKEHLRFWTKTDLIWWLRAQGYNNYKIHYYVGIPFLKKIWPNVFAAGLFVELIK